MDLILPHILYISWHSLAPHILLLDIFDITVDIHCWSKIHEFLNEFWVSPPPTPVTWRPEKLQLILDQNLLVVWKCIRFVCLLTWWQLLGGCQWQNHSCLWLNVKDRAAWSMVMSSPSLNRDLLDIKIVQHNWCSLYIFRILVELLQKAQVIK